MNPTSNAMVVLLLGWGILVWFEPVQAYEVDNSMPGVKVTGRVTFIGSVPKLQLLTVHRDSQFCGQALPDEALQVDEATRGIKAVVISLEGIAKGKPLNTEIQPIKFENRTCRFLPKAGAAVIGSELEIINADPILHNTHIRLGNRFGPTVINVAQPAGTRVIRKPIHEFGILDIRCDAHSFMHASIHVFEHPYFAVTDAAGQFELTRVPPGKYKLRIWHEVLGTQEKSVTVSAPGPITMNVEFSQED